MPTTSFDDLRVLIVDDDPFFSNIVRLTLGQMGVGQVDVAVNGEETLGRIQGDAGYYDVILSDLNMPRMDGVELLRCLAKQRFSGGIVLLTAEDLKILKAADALARAHGLRLLGVLPKPLDRVALGPLLAQARDAVQLDAAPRARLDITRRELRAALDQGQFVAHFQPQVSIATRRLVGMEALARWQHPAHGLLAAGHFIPLIEDGGMGPALTEAMLRDVMRQVTALRPQLPVPRVSVNVPMGVLADVRFPDRVQAIADEFAYPLGQLVLEITERQFMEHATDTLDTLIRLRLKGVELAVDDFGTGYSNLAQLKHAPVSELKIDRSFVTMGRQDEEGRAILEAAVGMGRKLGLRVITEGVEDAVEWALVHALGADEVQGYYVARPMPATELQDWLSGWQQAAHASGT